MLDTGGAFRCAPHRIAGLFLKHAPDFLLVHTAPCLMKKSTCLRLHCWRMSRTWASPSDQREAVDVGHGHGTTTVRVEDVRTEKYPNAPPPMLLTGSAGVAALSMFCAMVKK